MKLSKSRRLAAVLALALTVSGITVPVSDKTSKAETKVATTEATATSGAAAMTALKNVINSTWTDDPSKQEKTLIERRDPVDGEDKLEAYAGKTLFRKDTNVKVAIYDIDKDYSPELFALYPKKLELYFTDGRMGGRQNDNVKPVKTIKNVKEVRKGSTKKSTFYVKTVSGKTTSYVTFKYDFDKVKTTAIYTVKGKTYKNGSKKITKKVFDKFLKTYNKAKKLSFKTPEVYADFHSFGGDIYRTDTMAVSHVSDDTLVLIRSKEDKVNPYVAFTCGNYPRIRYVFGKDEAADWNAFRKENVNPIKFVTIFDSIINDPSYYDVTYTKNEAEKQGTYIVDFADGGDIYYEVIVDESTQTPKPVSVECISSIGTTEEMYRFHYGDDAYYDGEIYEPGSFEEVTADNNYVTNNGCTVRTITVDCAGTTREIKTTEQYRFEPWTDPAKGKLTLPIDGKDVDYMSINLDTKEWKAAEKILNPKTSDNSGFGQPTDKLTWTAK